MKHIGREKHQKDYLKLKMKVDQEVEKKMNKGIFGRYEEMVQYKEKLFEEKYGIEYATCEEKNLEIIAN